AERADIVDELLRNILMHAADAEVCRVHARAGCTLIEHHQLFALFETPERRRQRTNVHRLRRDVEKMRKYATDLGIKNTDQLPADRHLDAEELFHRKAERMLLVHRRDVIETVEIRDRLQISLRFDQLLGAAMQETDMRINALDDLAV